MDGNGWKWLELREMAGKDWTLAWMEMAENGWKWLEMAGNGWNGWTWL